VRTKLPNFGYQLHFTSGEIETAVQSPQEIRQLLHSLYGARTTTPDRQVAFSAADGVNLALLPSLGKTRLLSDEEMDYYVQEYARHGIHGPLNWYRTREVNYVDELEAFFDDGKNPKATPLVEQEVLFVLAKKDQALKPFMAERMGERIPNFTRKEVDAGHWALWERPEEINKMIGDWLEEKVFAKQGVKSKL